MHIFRETDYASIGELYQSMKTEPVDFSLEREKVREVLEAVRKDGDRALIRFIKEFEGLDLAPEKLKVSPEEFQSCEGKVSKDFASALKIMIKNVTTFHKKQTVESFFCDTEEGARVGQVVKPIDRVGVYVPGGRASYPSTAVMAIVPARVAGVHEISVCTPADREGQVNPNILYTLKELKVDEVYRVGGAQAIAAFAYGTETIKRVDKVVGPGNIYVSLAKMELFGEVGVDFIAGPTEIVILADERAKPELMALDMLSQVEHGSHARAILVTPSEKLLAETAEELRIKIGEFFPEEGRRKEAERNCYLVKVEELKDGVELVNLLAPEHLEIVAEDFTGLVSKIKNAGAIFLGSESPVCLGDYVMGTNHIIPTQGNARFASPLGVYDFIKCTNVIFSNYKSNRKLERLVEIISEAEGLPIHYQSLKRRGGGAGT